ncbi:hypothetical protein NA56DRAFT_674124 [Hyaloscypha hepaticicola]|uniref:DUF6594 domain-containing protein n=1 Tax=Hyaloscypha hepaticicola TaxID=2082293 RepID=A0A2J6PL32_9HELO|nr:hypothetical protein NA56DRAFT_674124 [Hyaloscypha hepaticicola]
MRAHSGRERERSRRIHHGTATGSRHIAKPRSKTTDGQRPSAIAGKDNRSDGSRRRHKRGQSGKSGSSSGSTSSDEEESAQDHRAVLAAARARLSSPSTMSAFTTATHNSGGSSSSNSTVTQDSITKQAGKKPEEVAPLSPAAPDPPNVFAFLDKDDSEPEDGEEEDHDEEDDQDEDEEVQDTEVDDPNHNHGEFPPSWASHPEMSLTTTGPPQNHNSGESSASSSFHGDDTFSQPADHDTDRSDSPDRIEEKDEAPPAPPPTDRVSAKVAAQIAAAQERQNLYAMQQFGTPNMPRGNYQLPFVPPSALSTRYQQQVKPHALPRAEKIPVTGYEKLASQLSYSRDAEERGERIRPMYRKFEALNHRILLHLQDEISELEEQLHRLDNADTQSRRTDRYIVPASRRAAAQAGGELQWHKTDVLGRIGYKLTQYNQALSSFNSTQSLAPPDPEDIDFYRSYLQSEHLIAEPETHFLDTADDLVSICSDTLPRPPFQLSSEDRSYDPSSSMLSSDNETPHHTHSSHSSHSLPPQHHENAEKSPLPALAAAIAAMILIPILTFNVIPNFIGRITVTFLVACFAVFGLVLSGVPKHELFGREGMLCAGVYGGVMIVVAGLMG